MAERNAPARSASVRSPVKESSKQQMPPKSKSTAAVQKQKQPTIIKRVKKLFGGKTKKKPSVRGSGLSTANSIYTRDDKTLFTTESVPDSKSVASTIASKKSQKRTFLQVVLLLMDPVTRRFELLQLEFDSAKAKVSDILRQIPLAVTEDIIRTIKYTGVCDATSILKTEADKLSGFCKGKDVLVAIPDGLDVAQTIRLARPILGDAKVVEMLESTGVDMTPWKLAFAKIKDDGTKAAGARTRGASGGSSEPSGLPSGSKSRSLPSSAQMPADAKTKGKSKRGSSFPWIGLLILLAVMLQFGQNYFTSPVEVGKPLGPGSWRSKCGLLGFVTNCDEMFLEVTHEGHANIYDSENNLVMTMHGNTCGDKEGCVEGMTLLEDGHIEIGGKKIKMARTRSSNLEITPWPFKEQPNVAMKSEPSFKMFQPV